MNGQITMFDFLKQDFSVSNKIRLIELFAGYGSQAMALTTAEKAKRYDALVFAIGFEKEDMEKYLRKTEEDLKTTADDSVGAMLIGRKYAIIGFLETLERWCK